MKQIIVTTVCLLISLFTKAQAPIIINTFAGNGTSISSGDGGPSTLSGLNDPFAACADDSGNVYIADCNGNRIRKVNAITGIITTVAGNGSQGFSPDGTPATAAEIDRPQGVAVDTAGNIYFSGYNSVVTEVIKSTGLLKTIAGGGSNPGTDGYGDGGPATDASFSTPTIGVAVDDSGNVYVADHYRYLIRKITKATGIITVIVGGGSNAGTDGVGDGGPGTGASLNQPDGIAVDDSANVYIADQWHNRIRKYTAKTSIVTCIAGNGTGGYSGDGGQGASAELSICSGVAADASGNIYIADTYNNVIRKVTKSTGVISTIAGYVTVQYQGTGNGTYSGDGGPATAAQLNQPYGVTVDGCGNVYSVETNSNGQIDNRVRIIYIPDSVKVSPNPATTCSGNSITLHASGANYYKWSPATGLSDTIGDSVVASPTIATTYTLTGGNGCAGGLTFVPATVAVKIGTAPPLTFNHVSPAVCSGQSITLSLSDTGTYTWTPSSGLNTTTGDSVVATPTVQTVYTVSEAGSGGCISTGTDTVKILPASALIIKPQDTSLCKGSSVILFAPLSGSSYNWSPSATLNSSIGDSVIATPTTQTTYTVTGTDSVGCSATGTDIIYVNVGFNKPVITDTNNILTSTATQGNQWYKDGTMINGATGQSYTATDTGCYWVIATNIANGCSSISDTICVKPTGIKQLSVINSQLSIYPNPTGGEIFINISSSVSELKDWYLQITDVLGRTVYTKPSLNYSNDIDLSGLPAGMYFISVINQTGKAVVPVVKQ